MKYIPPERLAEMLFQDSAGHHSLNHLGYNVVIHYENSEMTKVEVNGVTFVRDGAQAERAKLKVPPELQYVARCLRCGVAEGMLHNPDCPVRKGWPNAEGK